MTPPRLMLVEDIRDSAHGDIAAFPPRPLAKLSAPPRRRWEMVRRAFIVGTAALALMLAIMVSRSHARDPDDRYAAQDPALHAWFDQLASGKGLCCSFADGKSIADVDWDTNGPNNTYRVRIEGRWIVVPRDAVVTEPNKFGPAVVWPYDDGEQTKIRCFLPGAGV